MTKRNPIEQHEESPIRTHRGERGKSDTDIPGSDEDQGLPPNKDLKKFSDGAYGDTKIPAKERK